MDAANVDLKGFSEDFYHKLTGAHLQPILDALRYLCRETSVWVELTTLLIPGLNDSEAEITRMCEWIVSELGAHVPLHFTAFHPDYRMADIPPTPPETLRRARQIAKKCGLRHVYTGNVRDLEGGASYCSGCGQPVIVRDSYWINDYRLDETGRCCGCQTRLDGHFGAFDGGFGSRRIPIRVS
jgi:pyruvate formate lyase activating enzyme